MQNVFIIVNTQHTERTALTLSIDDMLTKVTKIKDERHRQVSTSGACPTVERSTMLIHVCRSVYC